MPRTPSRGRNRALVLSLVTATTGAAVLMPVVSAQAAPNAAALTATVYKVVQEGLTADAAATLAKNAGVGNALRPDGSFAFTDEKRFGRVPAKAVSRGVDESGQATLSEAVDFDALG